jgi:hypothetical protein
VRSCTVAACDRAIEGFARSRSLRGHRLWLGRNSARRRWRWLRRGCAPYCGEVCQIFLPCLECCGISGCSAFRVHRKQDWPDDNSNDASDHILRNLGIVLRRQGFGPFIIGLNFSVDHSAVAVGILRLHSCDRLWVTPRASRQREANGHRETDTNTHRDPHPKSRHASSDNHAGRAIEGRYRWVEASRYLKLLLFLL